MSCTVSLIMENDRWHDRNLVLDENMCRVRGPHVIYCISNLNRSTNSKLCKYMFLSIIMHMCTHVLIHTQAHTCISINFFLPSCATHVYYMGIPHRRFCADTGKKLSIHVSILRGWVLDKLKCMDFYTSKHHVIPTIIPRSHHSKYFESWQ